MGVIPIHTRIDLSANFESPIGTLKKVYCPSLRSSEKPCQDLDLSVGEGMTLSQFQYTGELDSRNIRLLDIKPGQGEDVIHLDLRTYPLDFAPSYVALSYTWGDPKDTSAILCLGQTLYVTRNLKEALWQLRESQNIFAGRACAGRGYNKNPYFWIDAICINQNDDDEKNHQVKLMWEIYSRADLVIAWLGKQDEFTKRGLELIKQITTVVRRRSSELSSGLGESRNYQSLRLVELEELGLPGITSPGWDYLFSVLSRQWFSRVWVIQEIVAAKECIFLCGGDIIDSSMLLQLGRIIEEDKLLASIRNFNRNRIIGVNIACLATLKLKEEQKDLTELLWSTHLFQATDPRDRVFAIVHMANGMAPSMISDMIDYRLETYEILNKTANICLRQGSLDLLSFAQAFGDLYSLPSWVPYWAASDYSYIPLIKSWDTLVSPPHTTLVESHYRIEENHTLVLEGKIFDKIEKIIKIPRGHVYDEFLADIPSNSLHKHALFSSVLQTKVKHTRNLLEFHQSCLAEIRKLFQYPTGQSLLDLYWRAYFMDNKSELPAEVGELFENYLGNMDADISVLEDLPRLWRSDITDQLNPVSAFTAISTWNLSKHLWKGTFLPSPLNYLCRFFLCVSVTFLVCSQLKELRTFYVLRRILYNYSHSAGFLNKHLETFTKAENRLSGRSFCITESGYVAWVSLYAKKGDEICAFRGCRFPFVVRKSGPRHKGKYRLRGDCYMHGLMGDNLFERARVDVETIKLV